MPDAPTPDAPRPSADAPQPNAHEPVSTASTPDRHPDGGWTNQAVARVTLRVALVLLGLAALLALAWVSRNVLIWFGIAAFLATAINPAVHRINMGLRLPRPLSVALVYVAGVILLGLIAAIMVPQIVDAANELSGSLPGYADQVADSRLFRQLDEDYGLVEQIEMQAQTILTDIADPGGVLDVAAAVANGLVAIVTIAVLTFLLSLYGPRFVAWVREQAPGDHHSRIGDLIAGAYQVVGGYVVGAVLISIIAGTASWVFLTILGVPGAPVLAFWCGLLTLVPLVGGTIGGVPYVAVAFFQGVVIGIAALVFLLVYQQVENNLIQPLIQRRTVNLNPLWVILAVLIGAQLLGIVGVLLAIPVAGITQVVIQDLWAHRPGNDDGPREEPVAVET